MITMSTEYAAHFDEIYIDGKEHAKMNGDQMKMLMLTLPFMVTMQCIPVRTSTCLYISVHTSMYKYILVRTGMYSIVTRSSLYLQVQLINSAIDEAKRGSYLHGLSHVADPSTEVQEVLIAFMNWNMVTRNSKIPECELPALQQMAVESVSTCLISCRKICRTRQMKRPNGIPRRHTVFYTRSARLCSGETLTTPRVYPQRYVPLHTSTYQYVPVRTSMY
jgi:hypothetical protein